MEEMSSLGTTRQFANLIEARLRDLGKKLIGRAEIVVRDSLGGGKEFARGGIAARAELMIELRPLRSENAGLIVWVMGPSHLNVQVGRVYMNELYERSPDTAMAHLQELIDVILEGNIREILWTKNGDIAKAKVFAKIAGEMFTWNYRNVPVSLLRFTRAKKTDVKYKPYAHSA